MKEFKASTKKGQQLIAMGNRCCWGSLYNLYTTWSPSKEQAYNYYYDEYLKSDNHTAFGVGNANTFGFTASWICTINDENAMRIETKDNSYIVWLDR